MVPEGCDWKPNAGCSREMAPPKGVPRHFEYAYSAGTRRAMWEVYLEDLEEKGNGDALAPETLME